MGDLDRPPPEVSVVIVNYNGRHLLDDCLRSVEDVAGVSHEIIVVDNASGDDSVSYLTERWSAVRTIPSPTNLGFGRGCNLGASVARGRFVLLLNSDARLRTSLRPALDHCKGNPRTAVVGGRLWYGDGRFQPSVGLEVTPLRLLLSWTGLGRLKGSPPLMRRAELDASFYETPHPNVSWVSGALMLIDCLAWKSVGGMCPEYFMYMEDVDFCRRVRSLGRHIDYLPEVSATHLEGGGKPWVGEKALLWTVESYRIFAERYFSPVGRTILRSGLAGVFIIRAAAFGALSLVRGREYRERCRAFFLGALGLARGRRVRSTG